MLRQFQVIYYRYLYIITGGHINPAITLAMCILGRTEWKKLIPYWLAQYIGAIAASACIYGVYLGKD